MHIVADHRERASGLIDRLNRQPKIQVRVANLKVGDYLIDDALTVERKQAHDFVLSIIDGRLFRQAAHLKRRAERPAILIEGNPYRTRIDIHRQSVRGALVCLAAVWQLPILYSTSVEDSAELLLMLGSQLDQAAGNSLPRFGYPPKRLISRQRYIVQGLPGIGPQLAGRLLAHFGSVAKVMGASTEQLMQVDGIGAGKAAKVRLVLDAPYEADD